MNRRFWRKVLAFFVNCAWGLGFGLPPGLDRPDVAPCIGLDIVGTVGCFQLQVRWV